MAITPNTEIRVPGIEPDELFTGDAVKNLTEKLFDSKRNRKPEDKTMGTALRLIAFSIAKNFILPRIIDEIINVLEGWAKRTDFTDIDDHVVKGLRAHRDEIVAAVKKAV